MKSPNEKGKRFERRIAKLLNKCFGQNMRRTPNSGGLSIKGDLLDIKGLLSEYHWELKAVERLNVHEAFAQSVRDCPVGKTPLLVYKRRFGEPMVSLQLTDFINILKEVQEYHEVLEDGMSRFEGAK